MKRLLLFLTLLVMLVASRAPLARAQTEADAVAQAKQLAERGRALYANKKYREAALAFAQANELAPGAGVLQNEGAAWERAGEPARGADAYETALAMGTLPAEFVADARRRLARLERDLGVLIVGEPQLGTIAIGQRTRKLPARVHLAPGTHEVVVTSPNGRRYERTVTVAGGEVQTLRLPAQEGPEPQAPPPGRATRGLSAAPDGATRELSATPDGGPGAQRVIGYVALGLGAAAGVLSLGAAIQYLRTRETFYEDKRSVEAHDEAQLWQAMTSASFYPALGLTALGVVLVLTAPDAKASVGVSPTGVAARVRF